MRRSVLSTFLFVAILGLGCMGVAVPSKADELKHPIELGSKCKDLFKKFLDLSIYHKAFVYAYEAGGHRYACGYDRSPRSASEACNSLSSGTNPGSSAAFQDVKLVDFTSFPTGTIGKDLGGCKVYAKSPVNGKLAIVWKDEPKQVAEEKAHKQQTQRVVVKHQKIAGKTTKQKPWAGYKTKKITDSDWELIIRYSDSGEKFFAMVGPTGNVPSGLHGRCEGAVDERGNLEKVDCTPDQYETRHLAGNVTRIKLLNTGGGFGGGVEFVDKKLAQRIKAEAERQRFAEEKARQPTEAEKKRLAEEARLAAAAEKKRLAKLKAEAEKKRLAELVRKKAEAERQRLAEEKARKLAEAEKKRLAEEARLAAAAEKKRLAKLKAEAEKKRLAELAEKRRLAELARKKAEAEKKRLAELARRKAEEAEKKRSAELARKKAEEEDRKLFAQLATGAKTYLGDVVAFLQSNPAAPIVLDAGMAVVELRESLLTDSSQAIKASLEELQQAVANSDDFAKYKAQQETKRKQQQMNQRVEAIAELKTYKQFLRKLLVRSLSKNDGTTKVLVSMIKAVEAGLASKDAAVVSKSLFAIKKQINANARIKKTYRQAEAYLKAEKQRQAQAARKAVETKQQATEQTRIKKDRAKLAKVRKANRYSVAVIIGNKNYQNKVPKVAFAHNDADAMRDFVVNKLGYDEGNIIDLRDTSKAKLESTFGTEKDHRGKLFSYVRPGESDVVVFYSGHGVPGLKSRKGYLLPVDADPDLVELNGYPIDVMLANLRKIDAKSTQVFVDACFSGDSPNGMLIRSASGITIKIKTPEAGGGMTVVTAAQGDQFASWDEDAKHGLFTKHLLEALNGKADTEDYGNQDGKITLSELQTYLGKEMTYQARRRYNRDQKASVQGKLDSVLATVR